jgi:hypothetical protein
MAFTGNAIRRIDWCEARGTYLGRIAAYDQLGRNPGRPNVNSHALQQAADLDAKFKASGQMAPLRIGLAEDQIDRPMPTTYGSAMFKRSCPSAMRRWSTSERRHHPAKTNMESSRPEVPAPPPAAMRDPACSPWIVLRHRHRCGGGLRRGGYRRYRRFGPRTGRA